jgi:sulfur carrier protein
MQITLNGCAQTLIGTLTLAELLEHNGYGGRRVAVEINRTIVPRSEHGIRQLADGDAIEIVHAMGGG